MTTKEKKAIEQFWARKAGDGRRAFEAYNSTPNGGRMTDDLDTDAHTALSDLFCDLMHLAAECGLEPNEVIASAENHYDSEREPDDIALSSALDDYRED